MTRHWMPLYVADYLAGTGHLTTQEHGAYMLLIMHYWSKGDLPNDDKKLARVTKMTAKGWLAIKETMADFFDDAWRHHRIDVELAVAAEKYEARAAAGQKGGRTAQAKLKQCSTNARPPLDQLQLQPQPQSERKKEEKKEVAASAAPSPRSRGSTIPEDWAPNEGHFLLGETLGFSHVEILEMAGEMALWAKANSNRAVARKADWDATFTFWVRRQKRDRKPNGTTKSPIMAAADNVIDYFERRGSPAGEAAARLLPDGRRE